MFILVQLKDTIRIAPEDAHLLQTDPLHLIRVEINNKYANKVIHDIGLCTLVHSILSYDDPQLFPSDPGPYVRCTFRLVIFQPQEGEVLNATIVQSNEKHLIASIDLFSQIYIEQFPIDSKFDPVEKVWVWNNDGQSYYFDNGLPIRFKVTRTTFSSPLTSSSIEIVSSNENNTPKALKHGYIRPTPQFQQQQLLRANPQQPLINQEDEAKAYTHPFIVYGSVLDTGLGPLEWWD